MFKKTIEQKIKDDSRKVRDLIADFPWLWALKGHWGSGDSTSVTVSQDMVDLRVVLSRPSSETSYKISCVGIGQYGGMFVRRLEPQVGKPWFEIIMTTFEEGTNISYIITSDGCFDGHLENFRIFREPHKANLSKLVEDTARIQGSRVASWRLVLPTDW